MSQAAVVQKHFRTLDVDVLPLLGRGNNLPAEWTDRIRAALYKVEMEIADSGFGLKTDGRRSLVAYRRLLDLLGWVSASRPAQGRARAAWLPRADAVIVCARADPAVQP